MTEVAEAPVSYLAPLWEPAAPKLRERRREVEREHRRSARVRGAGIGSANAQRLFDRSWIGRSHLQERPGGPLRGSAALFPVL